MIKIYKIAKSNLQWKVYIEKVLFMIYLYNRKINKRGHILLKLILEFLQDSLVFIQDLAALFNHWQVLEKADWVLIYKNMQLISKSS